MAACRARVSGWFSVTVEIIVLLCAGPLSLSGVNISLTTLFSRALTVATLTLTLSLILTLTLTDPWTSHVNL